MHVDRVLAKFTAATKMNWRKTKLSNPVYTGNQTSKWKLTPHFLLGPKLGGLHMQTLCFAYILSKKRIC